MQSPTNTRSYHHSYAISLIVYSLSLTHSLSLSLSLSLDLSYIQMMVAGDPRINDQFGLLSYHHLWALNHNYWANKLAQQNPSKSDEELFHLARQYNVAEFQSIAYNQFLPLLLGDVYNPVYPGYSADVDASANQEFLGGCMRWGHTAISPLLLRRTVDNELTGGDTFIRDAFFQPDRFVLYNGYESVLYGLMYQRMQQVPSNHALTL